MRTGTPVWESAGFRTARIVRTVRSGSSGATVRIVRQADGTLLAVKTAVRPRVTAREQAAARDAIAPLFGDRLPGVLFAGELRGTDTLITHCPSPTTLAEVSTNSGTEGPGPATWRNVVAALCQLWDVSARSGFDARLATRRHHLRWQRGTAGLRHTFQERALPVLPRHHVVVNGRSHGTLGEALSRLARIPPPDVHVTCQGDPQPRNILLDSASRWYLVDWEWAGNHHDWRMMTSHLLGWWFVERLVASSRGHVRQTRDALVLTYESPDSSQSTSWTAPAAQAFFHMSRPGRHQEDLTALARHTAMLLLREVPTSLATARRHLLAPLLGEAVRLIEGLHPLLDPFASRPSRSGGAA